MSSKTVTVRILNWRFYNGRRDVTHPSWFRLEYRLVENPDFYDFTHEEFKAWIYILSQACRINKDTVIIRYLHAKATARISKAGIDGCLDKLMKLDDPPVDVTQTSRKRNSTGQDRTGQDRTDNNADFDFEAIYRIYPRKQGKRDGIQSCIEQIKTQQDYDDLRLAVERYAKECEHERKSKEYIKYFSTFMGTARKPRWRDYLDDDVGTSTVKSQSDDYTIEELEAMWSIPEGSVSNEPRGL